MNPELSSKDIHFVAPDINSTESDQAPETIQWPEKVSEEQAQAKLTEVLSVDHQDRPTLIDCQSTSIQHSANLESNFTLYKIIEPVIRSKKILELFCGNNTAKQYFSQKQIPGETVGVDNQNPSADILADVAKLSEVLPPEHQFDIITNLGGVDGIEDYKTDTEYLTENGLYIYSCSGDWFEGEMERNITTWINGGQITNEVLADFNQYFQPLAIMRINGIKLIADWPDSERAEYDTNEICIICKKKDTTKPTPQAS